MLSTWSLDHHEVGWQINVGVVLVKARLAKHIVILTNVLLVPKVVVSLKSFSKLLQSGRHIEGKGGIVHIHD